MRVRTLGANPRPRNSCVPDVPILRSRRTPRWAAPREAEKSSHPAPRPRPSLRPRAAASPLSAAQPQGDPTTNLLERLFLEERRRTTIVPHAVGEHPVVKLMYAAMIRSADRWCGIAVGEF